VNYKQLQELYSEFATQGFTVLAFPCNQFGGQEPGSNADIKKFAQSVGAEFPMFAKINVNGREANPLWKYLKNSLTGTFGQSIKWNFTKFLVDKNGVPFRRFGTPTDPVSIRPYIETLLAKNTE